MRNLAIILVFLTCRLPFQAAEREILETDVCVYGGTASGVTAALAAARRGQSVIIVEPFRHLGGMHGGGIRIRKDCKYYKDIGGIAREMHDADRDVGGSGHSDLHQWGSRQMLKRKCVEASIRVFTEHRLDSKEDVVKNGATIEIIYLNHAPIMDEGVPPPKLRTRRAFAVKAKVYIDASYEGDLMAFAGCENVVGREARSTYNESLGGQRGLRVFDVDPYVVPGDPSSGVLPMITTEPYKAGAASQYMIAYNFRLQFAKSGGTPIQPLGREIDERKYELVTRALKTQGAVGWPSWNYDRYAMISAGVPGRQADYPDGDWATRSAIWREWIDHVKTMNILCKVKNSAMVSGEYPDNHDFPDALYTRMCRRMIGQYVVTQHDLMHQTVVDDSIGLAYYAVDIYPTRLIAHQGKVASEGETWIRVSPGPYPLSYRALIPKKDQCTNLIVPICMSASHVAMASIRMESSYVVMGEAAGTAASHAVTSGKTFHEVDVAAMRADMKKPGVVMEWDGTDYGPHQQEHRTGKSIYWQTNPEEYRKIPIRLDPSWKD